MNIRKDITSLLPTELADLRQAFKLLQEDETNDGYEAMATLHGLPGRSFCPHHLSNHHFLPWHRQYLLNFEKALQSKVPGVTLPYWDWAISPPPATDGGLPPACSPQVVAGIDQNPLSVGPMNWVYGFNADAEPPLSTGFKEFLGDGISKRDPRDASLLHSPTGSNVATLEADALLEPIFAEFSDAIERPHDLIHGHVGHHMGAVSTSAFDPIFWIHHCNIDRQWALWQLTHKSATQHPHLTDELTPFGINVSSTIDVLSLGYDYEGLAELRSQEAVPGADLAIVNPGKSREFLHFDTLKMQMRDSVDIRVFIDEPTADSKTTLVGNPKFNGNIFVLGMGGGMNPDADKHHSSRKIEIPEGTSLDDLQIVAVTASGETVDLDAVLASPPRIATQKPSAKK